MKIGVIADTHDNMPMIKKAIDIFNSEGCRLVIHAGDYCAPFSLDPFSNLKCKWIGVFGNNDGDKKALAMKSDGLIVDHPYNYELSDKKVVITHEIEDIPDLDESIEGSRYDIIICAHTHKVDIKKKKDTLIVNPGECCGWLYGKSTVAIIDLTKMEAKEIAF
ncbi:MAG: hypothetical protein AMJ78_01505 [Omnitrophica WOR_2 bacterium SM23_29]|nr:MAG: hypothetical protein AMJ78_01505 [Omnitrophica WOR_2 bacterium SM23_29]